MLLRTLLITTALLTGTGSALAHGSYGRVISVEPHVVISFGTGRHDGFRVLYETGGQHYWTHSPYYPGRVIMLPPRHRIQHIHHHHYRDGRGWDDRRDWKDRRDWRDDRRDWRNDRRDHRRYDRY